jgi:hypothetical protein
VQLALIPNGLPSACWLGGTASSACSVLAPPNAASERCAVGNACVADLLWEFSPNGACLKTCDDSVSAPAGAPSCAAGETCVELPLLGSTVDAYGVCITLGDGGCREGVPEGQTELEGCFSDDTCACPEVCVPFGDAGASQIHSVCELPCATSADCPNPTTQCNAGLCTYVACDGGLTCAFGDAGTGTCLAPGFSWFSSASFCVSAGTESAGQACSNFAAQAVSGSNPYGFFTPEGLPGVPALAASQACAPGLLCVALPDGGGACEPACTSGSASCGDAGSICYPLDPSGYGFCTSCASKGLTCTLDGQCCSGSCATDTGLCN